MTVSSPSLVFKKKKKRKKNKERDKKKRKFIPECEFSYGKNKSGIHFTARKKLGGMKLSTDGHRDRRKDRRTSGNRTGPASIISELMHWPKRKVKQRDGCHSIGTKEM